ncbi:MAG: histidine kinase, partial [Acidimicrobiales bacterium]
AGSVPGAFGVLVDDPGKPLDRALADARLIAAALLAVLSLLVGWLFFRALVRPLFALKDTAGRIAAGDLEATFEPAGSDEVADLARSLERMRTELRAQLDLIAEQAEALRNSSHRIVAAQDEERHRLARDLHDGIQQHLVVLRMGFGLAKEAAERTPGPAARSLDELGAELDAVIERLREVSHDLYPSILVDRGLAAALRSAVGRLPVPARLACRPDPLPRLPPEIESGAYFLVGEAVANALKHAGAGAITIDLELGESELRVAVRDDGRGFDAEDTGHRAPGRPAPHAGPSPLVRGRPAHPLGAGRRHRGGGHVPAAPTGRRGDRVGRGARARGRGPRRTGGRTARPPPGGSGRGPRSGPACERWR